MKDNMEKFKENIENFSLSPKFVFKDFKHKENISYLDIPMSRDSILFEQYIQQDKEINKNFYRCDNFKKEHNGKHILFSGCSVTYGTGLLLEEVWSKLLYEKIKSKSDCSGFFNLAIPGSSIPNQIIEIFKYCKEYGNPDYIFFNMPDKFRFYSISKTTHDIVDSLYGSESLELVQLISYQYYFMLDQYCRSNNIKLYSFTWSYPNTFFPNDKTKWKDKRYTENKFKLFNTYYDISQDDLFAYIVKYKKDNKNDKYYELARDDDHFGTAYHQYWSDFFYKLYLQDNNE
jgi:hypothetical protein